MGSSKKDHSSHKEPHKDPIKIGDLICWVNYSTPAKYSFGVVLKQEKYEEKYELWQVYWIDRGIIGTNTASTVRAWANNVDLIRQGKRLVEIANAV